MIRRAHSGVETIRIDNRVVGLSLGTADCADHSHIRGLQQAFGLPYETKVGFERSKNTLVPEGLLYVPEEQFLAYRADLSLKAASMLSHILGVVRDFGGEEKEFVTAWDANSFAVRAAPKHIPLLERLYTAFHERNGVIQLQPRQNSGLVLELLDYRIVPPAALLERQAYDRVRPTSGIRSVDHQSG
jgi:hypothetical protein